MIKNIFIAGGGFSGLYSALKLSEKGHSVTLIEASPDRWGGRMETSTMEGFITEWGPMRFETQLGTFYRTKGKPISLSTIRFTFTRTKP